MKRRVLFGPFLTKEIGEPKYNITSFRQTVPLLNGPIDERPSTGVILQFPKQDVIMAAEARRKALTNNFGRGAVVLRIGVGKIEDPMTWGIVMNLSDVLRDGKIRPIGIKWLVGVPGELDWCHEDDLFQVHDSKLIPHLQEKLSEKMKILTA